MSSIQSIQQAVVGMYSEHPWPLHRRADEEMGWRLKCLGIVPEDYGGKRVLDLGCGTGEYALWYATHGAREVVGADLSEPSLAIADRRRMELKLEHASFQRMDLLECSLPDEYFDYSFSVGVLHHTGDPLRGFEQLVRVTKPGGIVVVSLYSKYSRRVLRMKQTVCRWLGGDDIDARVQWGERLFAGTLRKLDKRYHGLNTKQIAYDVFGFPHESLHSAGEVLRWFDQHNVRFKGAFAPLRLRDYLYAFAMPEYRPFRATLDGFPVMRSVSDILAGLAPRLGPSHTELREFPRPGPMSRSLSQLAWVVFGLRFNCFTIAGVRQ
jgi:SAM-dependent methyltransferase